MASEQKQQPKTLQLPKETLDKSKWAWKRPSTANVRSVPVFEDIPLEKLEIGEPSTSMNNADLEKCDPNRPQTIQGDVDGLKENPITRPLQSSLKQPRNGNEKKKGVSFSPDVPLETPNRAPLHEVMRQKDNHNFVRRCCLLIVVIILIVIGVLILASTIHETKKDNSQILS